MNTVRDLATYSNGATAIAADIVYSAYGQQVSSTIPANGNPATVGCLFGFTGRPLDNLTVIAGLGTGLQNNGNRWYDADTGSWLSQDPKGFVARDANLYRYCGNAPAREIDPSGEIWDWINPWHPDFFINQWFNPPPAPPVPVAPPPGLATAAQAATNAGLEWTKLWNNSRGNLCMACTALEVEIKKIPDSVYKKQLLEIWAAANCPGQPGNLGLG